MPYVSNGGVKLFFESHGPQDRQPVLLSHGYGATSQMWRGQIEPLVAAGRRVIVWDMRGHGQTDSPADQSAYSEEATVSDMAAILDECGLERAVIGGLSLGGYMSMAFHLVHPARTEALLLFDTGPGYKKDEARDGWNDMAERRAGQFETKGLDALGRSSEVRVSTHRSAEGLAKAARGMLAQRDARVIESLPSIAVPTLIVVGSEDKGFLAGTDYMAAKIPAARKVVIQGAGHAANIDAPEEFNRVVVDFLDGISA